MSKVEYGIMLEASKREDIETDDVALDNDVSSIEDVMDGIDELEGEIEYTDEMVNVIEQSFADESTAYLVEMENLSKYMKSNKIEDYKEALTNIAECNNLDPSKMAIVIESSEVIMHSLMEAKKARKVLPNKMRAIKSTADFLGYIRSQSVKVFKRKGSK